MLQGNEHFVIVKLLSGEQIMAVLEHESETKIHLAYPMQIRLFPTVTEGKAHEQVTATPYSQFAEDSHITINKNHVIYIKNLHQMLIDHFMRLVEENEKQVLVSRRKDGNVNRAEELNWEDQSEEEVEELTDEEIKKRIDMLESILTAEEESENTTLIEGNNTIH